MTNEILDSNHEWICHIIMIVKICKKMKDRI